VAGRNLGIQELVEEFHEKYGFAIRHVPTIDVPQTEERLQFIVEEVGEIAKAFRKRDLTNLVQEMADVAYVLYGSAVTMGFDLDTAIREVHRANMTKSLTRNSVGKPAKAVEYLEPQEDKLLAPWRGLSGT